MEARLTTKPAEQVIAAIQALDLEPVKLRIMDPELGEGWTREYADSIETAYRHYLAMLVKYPDDAEDILLSKDVDEFWHTHILQTTKYAADCRNVFGNFLHHDPHIGERTPVHLEHRAALAEKTRRLYEREFGNAQNADAAWSGHAIKSENAAFSNAAVNAAFSNAAIRADNAAFSNMSIGTESAAFSNAAIRAENAAFSNAAIRAENAAFSNVAIRSEQVAHDRAERSMSA
ncbi:MAG: hypothetical protein HY526_12840 [Betaproteobacteria bacterium]|nr:hypothetical protein [Betaproteobacteria bacterium]